MSVPSPFSDPFCPILSPFRFRYLRSSLLFPLSFHAHPSSRVRCDLKDLPVSKAGRHPSCSNCKERGLKCVYVSLHPPLHIPPSAPNSFPPFPHHRDEYGQVKSVKLLRRGRRLQQAEYVQLPTQASTSGGYAVLIPPPLSSRALYGKVRAGDDDDALLTGPSPPSNVTPMPTPAFFDSQFWRRFQLQRAYRSPITSMHLNVFSW